ncbi:MAG: hypothetical protein EBZ48_14915, partial [Proteobacteria bacterium]|nr:hypothetical protein [Pseudomonadota bacterium]
ISVKESIASQGSNLFIILPGATTAGGLRSGSGGAATLTTVLLGGDADFAFLKTLAEVGGGGFYQTNDARTLPRIFLQDMRVSTGERTMKESSEYDVRLGTGEVRTTSLRAFPPLRGYVQTRPRPQAALELVALAAERAEPVLASWQYGKGRVVAFTSDANGRWSSYWTQWPKFYQFWTELVDSIRSTQGAAESPLRFNLRPVVERGELRLALEIFGERDPGEVFATVQIPDGSSRPIPFAKISKGLYEARIRSALPGRYQLGGSAAAGGKLTPVAFYLSGELFGERKGQGFNRTVLERLAADSGGEVNPASDRLSQFTQTRKLREDISHWLALAGMLLLALSTLVREYPAATRRFGLRQINRSKIKT